MAKMLMKRCLIVTFVVDNFGACLQAFALQNKLIEMGITVNILKYSNRCQSDKEMSIVKKIIQFTPKRLLQIALLRKESRERKSRFNDFRENYLKLTEPCYYRDSDYTKLADQYDIFVCGSDMIWSEVFVEDWPVLYLSFAKYGRRMAYGPSFGKNAISEDNKRECTRLLADLSFISCREAAGCRLIQEISDREDVYYVLDPTLLYDGDKWRQMLCIKNPIVNGSYVLVYVFGGIKGYRKEFFKKLQVRKRIIYIPMGFEEFKLSGTCGQAVGPIEFVNLFSNAEAVITDTYHGMLFSIIFEKPFYVLKRKDSSPWAKQEDRMKDMLEQLEINERLVDENVDLDNLWKMNYKSINSRLEKLRGNSIRYLKEAIDSMIMG